MNELFVLIRQPTLQTSAFSVYNECFLLSSLFTWWSQKKKKKMSKPKTNKTGPRGIEGKIQYCLHWYRTSHTNSFQK